MLLSQRQTVAFVLGCTLAVSPALPAATESGDWVARSDQNTAIVTELFARYLPELMGQLGAVGVDEQIQQLPLDLNMRAARDERAVIEELRRRREAEGHPAVRQDIDILIDVIARDLELSQVEDSLMLPYFDVAEQVFRGIRALLDEQVPAERRAAALVRLRRYAGAEDGYTPLAEQTEAYIRARFDEPGLLGPFREEVESDLARAPRLIDGLGKLFEDFELTGYDQALGAFREQLTAYHDFVRQEVLPRARNDFRLPPELYAMTLKDLGVDMPVAELRNRAKTAFKEIQNEMHALALWIAEERDLDSADYRDVLRHLQREQLVGEAILDHYKNRIAEVEALVERHQVVTLPTRELRLRIASEAESAVVQAATIRWPQLLGDAAEVGEIILPLTRPATGADEGDEDQGLQDFTFEAASWSLVVHEGRPGHELQMASILEQGVSKARAFYAFNSTNVEGWALYAESEMKPYLPIEGQLVSLQHRLLRAARAFLDPGLQLGEIDREQAMRILTRDVVISKPLAEQEVERYTSRSPGQATSYFCGYSRLLELRADAERVMGETFDRRAFNDLLLAQGLLPPKLMREAVMEQLAAQATAAGS